MAPAKVTRVYALGGSILAPSGPSATYAAAFASFLLERLALGENAYVVTGGGQPARRYIEAARGFTRDEDILDRIGIDATRMNARFLAVALADRAGPAVAQVIPKDVEAAAWLGRDHRIVVMGGTQPGHSTDFVAASLATQAHADELYVLTNIDGVYNADPRTDPKAKRVPELTSSQLLAIVGQPAWTAGLKGVVDPKCARHAHEHRLPITVLDGRDTTTLRRALAAPGTVGSRVVPDAR